MKIIFDNKLLTPLYKQLSNQVEKQILDGTLENGYNLPSIRNFAKELEISVITVKKAYEILVEKKLIESKVGKGFFVGGENSNILGETIDKKINEYLREGIKLGNTINLSKEDLIRKLEKLYREET
ncbi:GntR family transcriptional regulator [uncultured Clostridium sp.]|uniref:GntR family transcriptional regulator n=1 Tax=uncultured Clostridium sp. TaxID=59620 RepID=UPI0026368251|nr:GntR family transcriptional regulator [uncultured Clostridium sp.]